MWVQSYVPRQLIWQSTLELFPAVAFSRLPQCLVCDICIHSLLQMTRKVNKRQVSSPILSHQIEQIKKIGAVADFRHSTATIIRKPIHSVHTLCLWWTNFSSTWPFIRQQLQQWRTEWPMVYTMDATEIDYRLGNFVEPILSKSKRDLVRCRYCSASQSVHFILLLLLLLNPRRLQISRRHQHTMILSYSMSSSLKMEMQMAPDILENQLNLWNVNWRHSCSPGNDVWGQTSLHTAVWKISINIQLTEASNFSGGVKQLKVTNTDWTEQ